MKTKQLIKETSIGSVVELSNVELLVIKSKWTKITDQLQTLPKISMELRKDVEQMTTLLGKICTNAPSLQETAKELFSNEEELTEEELKAIEAESTGAGFHEDIFHEDEERAERRMEA